MAARKPARKKPTTKRTTSSSPVKKNVSSVNKTPNLNKLAQVSKVSGVTKTPTRKTQTTSTPGKKAPQTFQEAILHRKLSLKGTPVHVLNIPYEAQYFAKSLGVEYNPYLKMYLYEGTKLNPQLVPYKAEPFSLEKWVEDSLNDTKPEILPPPKMKPRPHQVTAIKKIASTAKNGWRGFILADNVGVGKGLAESTLLPTPNGMKRMKDLQIGDYVIDIDGNATKILEKHLSKAKKFYEIEFSDGTIIQADEDHRWVTETARKNYKTQPKLRLPEPELVLVKDFLFKLQEEKLAISRKDLSALVPSNPSYFKNVLNGLKPVGTLEPLPGKTNQSQYLYHPQEVLERVNGNLPASNRVKNGFNYNSPKTTKELLDTLNIFVKGKPHYNHTIATASANFSEKELLIHPYVLGVWLGDGSSQGEEMFFADELLHQQTLLGSFTDNLRKVYQQEDGKITKHIPEEYLLSSKQQRLELLKGLMDMNGLMTDTGVSFSQKNSTLFFQVLELIASLGFKSTWEKKIDESYELLFCPDIQVFNCESKKEKLAVVLASYQQNKNHKQRTIKAIKEISKSEEYYCISVDAPSHQYLVTRSYVPTHNTITGVLGAYLAAKQKGFTPQNKAKVLVVAPKSALPHWRNTLTATSIDNLKVVVINYDQSKKLLDAPASAQNVKKTVTANRHTMTKGKPTIQWDIIIADESHKLKNESQRSAAFANIARYEANATKAPFVIWTSATVGQEPLELGYLAPLVGQMCGVPNLTHETWGDWLVANNYNVKKSKAGNFSWVRPKGDTPPTERAEILALQQKDVSRLSELIFHENSPSIRRNPEDIAGWPTQSYVATPVQLAPEGYRLYEEAWNEFRRYIGLNPRGKNPSGGLAATLRFRQKASMLSALATAEYVNDLLDNGLQVAISVEFIETLDVMKDYLSKKGWHVAEFSGRNTVERENERLRFQKGEAQVMVFTVKEAISLHANEQLPDGTKATSAKRAMVVHDIHYSAIDMTQIIGRTTRDGELAVAYLMFTDATIEARILQTVLERMKNVRTLSGDDEGMLLAVQNILDGI